ncbi:MAG TPA: lytic transglycosylase domain-containing protein [Burkholderiaceae bacterium]|nr:lytic transglycosylase domain-containing protein [Burkholderiaceae bacterium]
MSSPTNVLLPHEPPLPPGLRVFAQDVASGMASAARFVVTLAGCTSLIAVAVAVGDPRLRDSALQQVETIAASLLAKEATAEPASFAPPGVTVPSTNVANRQVEPAQRHVVTYLARRYRVADGALRPVVAAAYESGRDLGLDPLLILAVTAIESSMNPFAESVVGAQGLMQVMTRVHADKFEVHGGEDAALDPIANIKVGSAILSDLIRRGGSVERGLQLYVGAGNMVDDGGYGARVLAEHGRLRLASTGKVDLAIANAMRAVAAEPKPASQTSPVSMNQASSAARS